MPRYLYECSECDEINSVFHGIDELYNTCAFCESQDTLVRLLTKPIIKKQINSDNKVGQITKEYIEENREILKEIKKQSKETDYEPT